MNEAEFHQFYTESGPILVGQLYAITGDASEAQDCVQEAFIKAWTRKGTLERYGNPHAWVRTTAYRLCVSRWRKAASLLKAYQRHGPPPSVEPPSAEHADLTAALAQLPLPQRQVVVLHYLCDLSVEEVAQETGLPVGTVKSRLHRARGALAQLLGPAQMPAQTGEQPPSLPPVAVADEASPTITLPTSSACEQGSERTHHEHAH